MVCFIILNFNETKRTIELVENLKKFEAHLLNKIIIVDNNSNDVSYLEEQLIKTEKNLFVCCENKANEINSSDYETLLIKNNKNIGYAKGNNLGLKITTKIENGYSCVLNPDIDFNESFAKSLIESLEINKDIAFISPLIKDEDGNLDSNCIRERKNNVDILKCSLGLSLRTEKIKNFKSSIIKTDLISGACLFARNKDWQKFDLFDEGTFLYFEEDILFEKICVEGRCMGIDNKRFLTHIGGTSTISNHKAEDLVEIQRQSLLYYLDQHRKKPLIKLTALILYSFRFIIIKLKKIF